jgi:hypothetical protein
MAGRILVKLTVVQDGSVAVVTPLVVTPTTIPDEVVGCIVRVVKRAKFPRTVGTGTATIPFTFVPRDTRD